MNCPKCGKALHPDERIVCTQCGSPLPRTFDDAPELFPESRHLPRGPFVAVAILLILVFVIAPAAVGFHARQVYQATVAQLAASGITVKVLTYHQGWFSSAATLSVGTPALETVLDQQIAHGPYPVWSGWLSPIPVAALIDSHPSSGAAGTTPSILPADLAIRTAIYFNGRSRTRITMPARPISSSVGSARFLGLKGEIVPLDNRLRVSLASPGFVGAGVISWSVSDLRFRGDWRRSGEGVWIGTTEYTIREMTVAAPGGRAVNLELIQRDAADSIDNGMLRLDGTIRISSAMLGNERVGGIVLAWRVKKIDPAAIQFWSKRMQTLQGSKLDKQALTAQAEAGLHDFTLALAAKGPQLDSNFSMAGPDGDVIAKLNLSIAPEKPASDAAHPAADAAPITLVKERVSGAATLDAPVTMVDRVAGSQRVADWLQNRRLVKNGKNYELKADFAGGKLMVNGKEVLDITKLPSLPKPGALPPGAVTPPHNA